MRLSDNSDTVDSDVQIFTTATGHSERSNAMKIDCGVVGTPSEVAAAAARAEALGFDGVATAEYSHDAFMQLLLAGSRTERIQLQTGIAVAFARTPMTVAMAANDLHLESGGRLLLGLGSQISAHIRFRFSMPWSQPAARMREFVLALRAIWACWNEGAALDFRGDFYQHTLMPPFFKPAPNPFGTPPVLLAAVGPRMTAVAGEVADGLLLHRFTTPAFVRDVTQPALDSGLAASGRRRSDLELVYMPFVVTGNDEREMAASDRAARDQIAFYGSTPAYLPVLAHHGWADLHHELHALSKSGGWDRMAGLIDDEVLDAFAVTGAPDEIPARLVDRFGALVDRFSLYPPGFAPHPTEEGPLELWAGIANGIKALMATGRAAP